MIFMKGDFHLLLKLINLEIVFLVRFFPPKYTSRYISIVVIPGFKSIPSYYTNLTINVLMKLQLISTKQIFSKPLKASSFSIVLAVFFPKFGKKNIEKYQLEHLLCNFCQAKS